MERIRWTWMTGLWLLVAASGAWAAEPAARLTLDGVDYQHRWSKGGHHEFTPAGQADLSGWRDMLTVLVNDGVRDADQLAAFANGTLDLYRQRGKVLRTDSRPATPQRPAEHLIVVVLGAPEFLEAVFARFMLVEGRGVVTLRGRREYGRAVGPQMSQWLAAHGATVEAALMEWNGLPPLASLRALPQAR